MTKSDKTKTNRRGLDATAAILASLTSSGIALGFSIANGGDQATITALAVSFVTALYHLGRQWASPGRLVLIAAWWGAAAGSAGLIHGCASVPVEHAQWTVEPGPWGPESCHVTIYADGAKRDEWNARHCPEAIRCTQPPGKKP